MEIVSVELNEETEAKRNKKIFKKEMKVKRHAQTPSQRLNLVDYSRATSAIYKRGYSNTRKSEVIHVYRDLVREKIIEADLEIEQCLLAAKAIGGLFTAVDFIPSENTKKDPPYILEVNSSPGTEGIEEANNKNIVKQPANIAIDVFNFIIVKLLIGTI